MWPLQCPRPSASLCELLGASGILMGGSLKAGAGPWALFPRIPPLSRVAQKQGWEGSAAWWFLPGFGSGFAASGRVLSTHWGAGEDCRIIASVGSGAAPDAPTQVGTC